MSRIEKGLPQTIRNDIQLSRKLGKRQTGTSQNTHTHQNDQAKNKGKSSAGEDAEELTLSSTDTL